ncbi:hypothetical protein PIB30_095574 [Stylosanthes scabra]|uniref:QWRF motif-containing protein 7 n=1 Tax=Stylosanthes scabra TaxID=79078 RepID=A0ABU6QWA2_9FABA|nr:hypothetical protein [Stylosanthes scabra]
MDKTSRPATTLLSSRTQPKLVRTTSGTAPITPGDRASRSERFITANNNDNNRSKSTSSRSRTPHSSSGATSPAMMNKVPSAWALSPGRSSLGSLFASKESESPPVKAKGGVRSKVLNYLKQRKGSGIEDEGYHRFRVLHNRLLQWRFINATLHSTVATTKTVAQMQLFSVWLRTLMIRKMIIQKRVELQNVKHLIKLYQIVIPQLSFLNEWEKLERKNQESVGRLERKLLALSNIIPLTHDLKFQSSNLSHYYHW